MIESLLELRDEYMLSCTHYCSYILLPKLQTDPFDACFGQYRQMPGGQYHVNASEILQSEPRRKVLSLITTNSTRKDVLSKRIVY